MGKQRRVELKSVGNFVAKTVLIESANQFSLEELCRTHCSLKYFFRSHIDHHTYGKTLMYFFSLLVIELLLFHKINLVNFAQYLFILLYLLNYWPFVVTNTIYNKTFLFMIVYFLCCLRSIAKHRDNFDRHLSIPLSVSPVVILSW